MEVVEWDAPPVSVTSLTLWVAVNRKDKASVEQTGRFPAVKGARGEEYVSLRTVLFLVQFAFVMLVWYL